MFQTDYAVPTGEYVEEWLEDHGMTQAELARRTGVSRKHISKVIAGAPVTADFATKLELVTGVPATRWLALESAYRADVARLGLEAELANERELAETFKPALTYLRSAGIVEGTARNPGKLLIQLMTFFGVGDVKALTPSILIPQVRFLQSDAFNVEQASIATWLRIADMEARAVAPRSAYDRDALVEALPRIRSLSASLDTHPMAFIDVLEDVGVRVVLQPEIRGCRAYGATFWQDGHPIVVLSARGKRDGALWFALFHELGHVLLHPDSFHLDDGDTVEQSAAQADQEAEASKFAEDQLVPEAIRANLYKERSKAGLQRIAAEQNISCGILMHHLHHHGKWERAHGNDLYVSLKILEDD